MTERIYPGARDLDALIDDIENRYMPVFLPEIRDVGGNSVGRRYFRLIAALIDDGHLHVDQAYREGFLATCEELESGIRIAEDQFYIRRGPSGARVTLRLRTINNAPAGVGGISIPQWSSFATGDSPSLRFLTLAPAVIVEGSTYVDVAASQGERRTNVLIAAGAPGTPNLKIALPATQVELELTQIRVDGVSWSRDSLANAGPLDQVFSTRYNSLNIGEVQFGDGEYGQLAPTGAPILADYIITRGTSGGVKAGTITKVLGALATQITVTNLGDSTEGFDGDSLSDIKRRAPASLQTGWRAVHESDAETLAVGVAGVYRARAVPEGALLRVYVQGDGGAAAPNSVLTDVLSLLNARRVTGTTVQVFAHTAAEVLIGAQVILTSRHVDRAQARAAVITALQQPTAGATDGSGVLHWSRAPFGRDLSLAAVAKAMESPGSIGEVDITKLTRRPAVVQSNGAAPAVRGLKATELSVKTARWVLTAIDGSTYQVAREGVLELTVGQVAVAYTPTAGEGTWTLGVSGDVLTAGDTWSYTLSPYRSNVNVGAGEIPAIRAATDIELDIVYEDEVGS